MKGIFAFLLIQIFLTEVSAQPSINGVYIGYEQNPFCYNQSCNIFHLGGYKLEKGKLYYKVTLEFTDTLTTITKIPIRFKNNRLKKEIIDSVSGGYYKYKAEYNGSLSGYLIECKYGYKSATATPRYTYLFYRVQRNEKTLFLTSENESNILFKKVE